MSTKQSDILEIVNDFVVNPVVQIPINHNGNTKFFCTMILIIPLELGRDDPEIAEPGTITLGLAEGESDLAECSLSAFNNFLDPESTTDGYRYSPSVVLPAPGNRESIFIGHTGAVSVTKMKLKILIMGVWA